MVQFTTVGVYQVSLKSTIYCKELLLKELFSLHDYFILLIYKLSSSLGVLKYCRCDNHRRCGIKGFTFT